jgi:hypothetical protein
MANLNGQNIGTNYKGFLNLDSTINTPLDATLRAVTDGMGTSSPFSISTAQAGFGTYTAASYANAKLIVGNYASANSEGGNIGLMAVSQATLNSATAFGFGVYGHGYTNGSARSGGVVGEGKVTVTGDTGSAIGVRGYANDTHAGGFNIGLYGDATGGSSNYALYMAAGDIYSAVSQTWTFASGGLTVSSSVTSPLLSGTNAANLNIYSGTNRGIYLYANNGSVNMASFGQYGHNIYAQLNVSGYSDTAAGSLKVTGYTTNDLSRFYKSDGTTLAFSVNSIGTLILGAATSSYPAIKRNGAAIDFRLADDSGYAGVNASYLILGSGSATGPGNGVISTNGTLDVNATAYLRGTTFSQGLTVGSNTTTYASALVAIESTTKGFLPPRMTTTQKNAISSPATGLVVFDTTLVKLAVYNGASWETVTSV